MEIKKFKSLSQLLLSKEFRDKDLSYCDLSGIDLSKLPALTWKNFKFDHTNFTDTGIKFYPEKLYKNSKEYRTENFYSIEYCNFTNCDLSYLTTSDLSFTSIKGCNFTNTNLNVELYTGFGKDANSDWDGLGYKDYSGVIFSENNNMVDTINKIAFLANCKTIIDNPNIPFKSVAIYQLLKKELPSENMFLSSKIIKELNEFIDIMLQEDKKREGNLVKFFDILNNNSLFTEIERIRFFQGYVKDKNFSVIDLSMIPTELIKLVIFDSNFEKIIFPDFFELNCKKMHIRNGNIKNACFPTILPESWQTFSDTRLASSIFTFYRNLYLELGRACNGNCKFCRNQYLEPCHYDLDNIVNSLIAISSHLDNIVIGGGEPTLLSEDVLGSLRDKLMYEYNSNASWTIFTNASTGLDKLVSLSRRFNFNISRHSVSDSINDQILGIHSLNTNELCQFVDDSYSRITLCATCFKGDGLDTIEKMEDYICYANDCGIGNILFQTLHRDLNDVVVKDEVLPIEEEIFDEVIFKLREQGYKIGIPIYSTGDYKMIIAKKNNMTISLKKYVTQEELEREWHQACKRTFDLSMDPSGNVYQNWHQSSGKVLLKSQSDKKIII